MAKKKLRDINKDGKVNFKDTWLGEKLTTKGKIKGPNLKESMAGARRGEAPKAKEKEFVSKYKPDAPGLIKKKVISPDPVVVEKIVKDLKDVIEKNPIKKVTQRKST